MVNHEVPAAATVAENQVDLDQVKRTQISHSKEYAIHFPIGKTTHERTEDEANAERSRAERNGAR